MLIARRRRRRRCYRPVPVARIYAYPSEPTRSRSPRKHHRSAVAWVITGLAIAYIVGIAAWAKMSSDRTGISASRVVRPPVKPPSPFTGTANMMLDSFDRSGSTAHTETKLTMIGTDKKYDVASYSFSAFRNDDKEHSRPDWVKKERCTKPVCSPPEKFVKFDFYGETVAQMTKVIDRVNGDIPVSINRSDAWFPFDQWQMSFRPKACVDDAVGGCINPTNPVQFTNVIVRASDSYRLGERVVLRKIDETKDGGIVLAVERQPFVRVLMVLFFSIGIAYVVYLARFEEPKEFVVKSLGLFAALMGFRSLLVPQQVLTFPTLIDLCVSVIAIGSFALALFKYERKGAT